MSERLAVRVWLRVCGCVEERQRSTREKTVHADDGNIHGKNLRLGFAKGDPLWSGDVFTGVKPRDDQSIVIDECGVKAASFGFG